jgi:hypothetical protein
LDWRFILVAVVVACHAMLNELRRNVLLRTLALVASLVLALACLFWPFKL